jgi:hypothetical protein
MRILLSIFIFFLVFFPFSAFSQGELDDTPRILYRNERSGAVYLNSNGIGAGFRYGQRINARMQHIYEIDLLGVKHPKEVKISNSYSNTRNFVFGKQNNFFALRAMYGRQNELYRKNDRGGISVRYFYSAGPVIGIVKPIYYEIYKLNQLGNGFYTELEKFNPGIHDLSYIRGRAPFINGISELSIIPGASLKTGLSFEYSSEDIILHSIDGGFSLDLYPKQVPIMANSLNDFFFFNLFVSYRFGRTIDISEGAMAASARAREDRKIQRALRKAEKKKEKDPEYF